MSEPNITVANSIDPATASLVAIEPTSLAPATVAAALGAIVTYAKAIYDVMNAIKSFHEAAGQPDNARLLAELGGIKQELADVTRKLGDIEDFLYAGSSANIRGLVASAEEALEIYLSGGPDLFLGSARDHSLQAVHNIRGNGFIWYSEIDTYVRASGVRRKWFEVAERKGWITPASRKAEMRMHAAHLGALITYLIGAAQGMVHLYEWHDTDTRFKPPVVSRGVSVYEVDERGSVVTSKRFKLPIFGDDSIPLPAQELYQELFASLQKRLGVRILQQLQGLYASLS